MKLKCNDGVIREFSICSSRFSISDVGESHCVECGYGFGYHDTKILKPRWKEHNCVDRCHNCNIPRDVHIIFEGQYNCKNCGYYAGKINEQL